MGIIAAMIAQRKLNEAIINGQKGERHTRHPFETEAGKTVTMHCRGDRTSRYFYIERYTYSKLSPEELKGMGEENAVSFLVEQLRALKEASFLVNYQRELLREVQADLEKTDSH